MHRSPQRLNAASGLVLLAVLAVLAGCAEGDTYLSPNELIPVGATEATVPQAFLDSIHTVHDASGQSWAKGFTIADQWEQVAQQVQSHALAHSYLPVQPQPIPEFETAKLNYDDVMRYYQSPGKTQIVGVVNLRFFRMQGAQLDGTADYVVFGGPDQHTYAPK
jgi:hypothetical protein